MEFSKEQYDHCYKTLKKCIPENAVGDVLQEILLQICEKGDEDINDIEAYVIGAAYKSYWSRYSPYARKFKQNPLHNNIIDISMIEEEIPEEPSEIDNFDIFSAIDEVKTSCWWEKEVVKRKILEGKTFKELAKEYNLSVNQVVYSYYKTIQNIKKSIKENEQEN